MQQKIRVGVIGGAGYTGGELIRILINHPATEIVYVHSNSNAGNKISDVHRDLIADTDMVFSSKITYDVDVLFLCVGHGNSLEFMKENDVPENVRIISLSQDFRLHKDKAFGKRDFVYGLPELKRDEIAKAHDVANTGCFATTITLGLLPLAKHGLLGEVYTTGITGSTGAGQTLRPTAHFSWRDNNIQAYKTLTHQHINEITEALTSIEPNKKAPVINFVPWRGDFPRGIFVTSQLKCNETLPELYQIYEDFYRGHPFIALSKEPVFLKQVVNTNHCFITLEKVGSNLVVHSILDNLVKGASGQAVQNMNIMFGLDETTGLKLKANYF